MGIRYKATGLNATPKHLWVYFLDLGLSGGRPRAVSIPWEFIADVHQDIVEGAERVFLERIKAQNDAAQLPLPLEKWE